MSKRRIFAVMPAYNEASRIATVIDGLMSVVDRVVVIDDGSTDGTGETAARCGVDLLTHRINLGQGAALQTGIIHALRQGADLIVTFDADGQHRPDDIPPMIAALDRTGAEIALGSRFLGSMCGIPRFRRLALQAAVLFTQVTTGLPVSDTHNGLRVLTRHAASSVCLRQNRMAHASEFLSQIARMQLPLIEVPVSIRYTHYSLAKGQRTSGAISILFELAGRWIFQ